MDYQSTLRNAQIAAELNRLTGWEWAYEPATIDKPHREVFCCAPLDQETARAFQEKLAPLISGNDPIHFSRHHENSRDVSSPVQFELRPEEAVKFIARHSGIGTARTHITECNYGRGATFVAQTTRPRLSRTLETRDLAKQKLRNFLSELTHSTKTIFSEELSGFVINPGDYEMAAEGARNILGEKGISAEIRTDADGAQIVFVSESEAEKINHLDRAWVLSLARQRTKTPEKRPKNPPRWDSFASGRG